MVRKTMRKKRRVSRVVLGFDGSNLTVDAGPIVFTAQATGAWPGSAVVSGSVVYALAAVPPVDDPVIVAFDGEDVTFGPVKVRCVWEPVSRTLLAMHARRD